MYYGDNVRWFVGTAIEINKSFPGKIKIRIHGIHGPEIDNSNLPWADIMLPTTEAGTSGIGRIPQLHPPAKVYGFFLDGKTSQSPIVLGSMLHEGRESAVQASIRTSINQSTSSDRDQPIVDPNNLLLHDGYIIPISLISSYNAIDRLVGGYGSNNMIKKSNIIMALLVQNGYNARQAAGIVGNLAKESFNSKDNIYFDPRVIGDGGMSYGLAQWNNSANAGYRWDKLKRYSSLRGLPESDFFGQLTYLLNTLNGSLGGSETDASAYSRVHRNIMNSTSYKGAKINNSTWYFLDEYENPANKNTEYTERARYAQDAFLWYETFIRG